MSAKRKLKLRLNKINFKEKLLTVMVDEEKLCTCPYSVTISNAEMGSPIYSTKISPSISTENSLSL